MFVRTTWWRTAALATAACVAASMTACAGSDAGTTTDDQSIVLATTFQSKAIDPAVVDAAFAIEQLYPVYDTLIYLAPDGTLQPGLATAWEFLDKGLTFQMTIRDGVVFHDDTQLTADAVKANLDRYMTLPTRGPAATTATRYFKDVKVVDPHTVQIHLKQPSYSLPTDLAQNIGMMVSPAAFDKQLTLTAVGAGPFKLVSFQPSVSSKYVKFDKYWNPDAVKITNLELTSVPDSHTRLTGVQSGQFTGAILDDNQLTDAQGAQLDIITAATSSVWNINLNLTRKPLDNVLVRQALQISIDRDSVVKNLLHGSGEPAVQMFPTNVPAYSKEYPASNYAYNPEKAKQLLAQAGFPNGVSLGILISNRPFDVQMSQALQQQMKAAGIDLQIKVIEPAQYSIFVQGGADMYLGQYGGRPDAADTLRSVAGAGGTLNPGGGTTEEMTKVLDKLQVTEPGDARDALVQQASGEFAKSALDVPVLIRHEIFATNGCIDGFQIFVNSAAAQLKNVGLKPDCGK